MPARLAEEDMGCPCGATFTGPAPRPGGRRGLPQALVVPKPSLLGMPVLCSAFCQRSAHSGPRGSWQGVEEVSRLGLPLLCSVTALLHPRASVSAWVRGDDMRLVGGINDKVQTKAASPRPGVLGSAIVGVASSVV